MFFVFDECLLSKKRANDWTIAESWGVAEWFRLSSEKSFTPGFTLPLAALKMNGRWVTLMCRSLMTQICRNLTNRGRTCGQQISLCIKGQEKMMSLSNLRSVTKDESNETIWWDVSDVSERSDYGAVLPFSPHGSNCPDSGWAKGRAGLGDCGERNEPRREMDLY